MSNNSNTVLTIFCIVTFIVCLSSLETNALSVFAQTDNIAMDNIRVSDTSNRTLNSGLSSWYVSQNSITQIVNICQMLQVHG
jgi:hypothetical protein